MVDLENLSKDADEIVRLALGVSPQSVHNFSMESKAHVEFSYLSYLTQLNTMDAIQQGNARQSAIQTETLHRMDKQIEEMKRQGSYTRYLAAATSILAFATIVVPVVLKYFA